MLALPEVERGSAPAGLLDTAAGLAVRGVNVVPLKRRDKRPAIDWKPLQASPLLDRDPDWLDRWLMRWGDHGVGAVTGAVSRIVVVDLDDDDARDLVERTCGWPETVTVKTRKGWHLWFTHPGGQRPNRAHVGDVGLDVRADGGYVVVPPSIHPSGYVYSWERSPWEFAGGVWPPAEMPPALVELIWPSESSTIRPTTDTPRSRAHGGRYVTVALEQEVAAVTAAAVGSRNDQLNRSVFAIARFVRSGQLPAGVVAQAFVDAARRAGLPDHEAERTVESALRSALA